MSQPIIVFEGPDCVGKTTLAKYTAQQLSAMYFHATASKTLVLAMQDYQRNVLDNAIVSSQEIEVPCVIDRHWPSEVCYGAVLRPGNPHEFNPVEFDVKLKKAGAIYVFCMSPFPAALARYKKNVDPDHPYDEEKYIAIYDEYYRFLTRWYSQDRHDYLLYSIEEHGTNMKDFVRRIQVRYHEFNATRESGK